MNHIVLAFDSIQDRILSVMLTSFFYYHDPLTYTFHIISSSLETELKLSIALIQSNNCHYQFYTFEYNEILDLNDSNHVPKATYMRLFILNYISKEIDKILVIDVDILFLGNIDCFFDNNLTNTIYAVRDGFVSDAHKHFISSYDYFNVGVLLINTRRLRNIFEQTKFNIKDSIIRKLPLFKYQDQDFWNYYFAEHIMEIPIKFNFMVALYQDRYGLLRTLYYAKTIKPAIVHFAGETKPWHNKSQFMAWSSEWRKVYRSLYGDRIFKVTTYYIFYGLVRWLMPRFIFRLLLLMKSKLR